MDDLSNPYQSAGKGDDEITGSSSKSDVGLCDRASAILPTNKDVAWRQLSQMMNAIMSAQTQEEKQSAKTKLANWVRRTGDDNPLFESNRHICKLLLAKEVISIEHAEFALHEMKVRISLTIQTDVLIRSCYSRPSGPRPSMIPTRQFSPRSSSNSYRHC